MFKMLKNIPIFFLLLMLPANLIAAQEVNSHSESVAATLTNDVASSEFISIKAFTAPGHIFGPVISPDGKRIVYKEKVGEENFLTILSIGTNTEKKRLKIPKKMNWYRWAGNDRLLFSVDRSFSLLGEPILKPGLYNYHLKTGENENIEDRTKSLAGRSLLHVDRHGRYLLLSAKKSAREYPAVYRVNLVDRQIVKIVDSHDRVNEWVTDGDGVVRMGLSFRGRSLRVYYRRTNNEQFEEIGKVKFRGKEEDIENSLYDIVKIMGGTDEGFLLSNRESDRFALYKFNYATREFGDKIFDHPENDVTDYHLNEEGTELLSVSYTDTRDRKLWFDERFKKIQAALEKTLPGQEVWIQSISRDGQKMIIFTTSSTDPGSYYLFEPKAGKLDRFGGINDSLNPEQMSPTRHITYKARDGLKIHAYLTLPKNAGQRQLPLVIYPHGGPYGVRDTPDFNRDVQFLANRGYAILQPNYRGSDSYGEKFYLAGEGEIGRKMQDDLDDGMDWLVDQGIVDRTRVCIYGASYGGYTAMWGLIRNPERYRCGISYAGVTDWNQQIRYGTKFFRSRYRKQWRKVVRGEKGFDLDSVSPAERIADLKRPLLIGQGALDTTVSREQYDLLLKRAKKANVKLETKLYDNDGHDLIIRRNQMDWLATVEVFLRQHNPPN